MTGLKPARTLAAWKLSGSVSLWRYAANTRNYPGWHLNADAAGCRSLLGLLDALATERGSYRTFPLRPPNEAPLSVPNNRRAAPVAATKLQLALSAAPAQWHLPPDHDPARLTIGSDWLAPLRQRLLAIAQGRGDYTIGEDGNGSLPLWFWWGFEIIASRSAPRDAPFGNAVPAPAIGSRWRSRRCSPASGHSQPRDTNAPGEIGDAAR